MNTKAAYLIASLILSAGTLMAQSPAGQTKKSETSPKSSATGPEHKRSQGGKTAGATSEATTGTPPTHIDKTNSVPAASNPQNTGVNASKRKKSASTTGGQKTTEGNEPQKARPKKGDE